MKAAGFVLLAATVPTALAGCSAIPLPKPTLAVTPFSMMLAICDNSARWRSPDRMITPPALLPAAARPVPRERSLVG